MGCGSLSTTAVRPGLAPHENNGAGFGTSGRGRFGKVPASRIRNGNSDLSSVEDPHLVESRIKTSSSSGSISKHWSPVTPDAPHTFGNGATGRVEEQSHRDSKETIVEEKTEGPADDGGVWTGVDPSVTRLYSSDSSKLRRADDSEAIHGPKEAGADGVNNSVHSIKKESESSREEKGEDLSVHKTDSFSNHGNGATVAGKGDRADDEEGSEEEKKFKSSSSVRSIAKDNESVRGDVENNSPHPSDGDGGRKTFKMVEVNLEETRTKLKDDGGIWTGDENEGDTGKDVDNNDPLLSDGNDKKFRMVEVNILRSPEVKDDGGIWLGDENDDGESPDTKNQNVLLSEGGKETSAFKMVEVSVGDDKPKDKDDGGIWLGGEETDSNVARGLETQNVLHSKGDGKAGAFKMVEVKVDEDQSKDKDDGGIWLGGEENVEDDRPRIENNNPPPGTGSGTVFKMVEVEVDEEKLRLKDDGGIWLGEDNDRIDSPSIENRNLLLSKGDKNVSAFKMVEMNLDEADFKHKDDGGIWLGGEDNDGSYGAGYSNSSKTLSDLKTGPLLEFEDKNSRDGFRSPGNSPFGSSDSISCQSPTGETPPQPRKKSRSLRRRLSKQRLFQMGGINFQSFDDTLARKLKHEDSGKQMSESEASPLSRMSNLSSSVTSEIEPCDSPTGSGHFIGGSVPNLPSSQDQNDGLFSPKRWKEKKAKEAQKKFKKKDKASGTSTSGLSLEDFPTALENPFIPQFVYKCVSYIEAEGLKTEGLYRIPGNKAQGELFVNRFSQDPNVDISTLEIPVNAIATLLKSFFSDLSEALIPAALCDELMEAAEMTSKSSRLLMLRGVIKKLPNQNLEVLKYIISHLYKVAEHQEFNSMNSRNLAKCWWPTLIRLQFKTYEKLIQCSQVPEDIVQTLIEQCNFFFHGGNEV